MRPRLQAERIWRSFACAVCLALAALSSGCARGCDRATADGSSEPVVVRAAGDGICPIFEPGVVLGRVQGSALTEISGAALSPRNADALWVHNDSGHPADVFALGRDGRLRAQYRLTSARNLDWEDLTLGPGPEPALSYIYVGDIGGNKHPRRDFVVYRVLEPELPTSFVPVLSSLPATALHFVYPDGAEHDAETLFLDPRAPGDLYVITKDRRGSSRLYRAPGPLRESDTNALELVATLRLPHTGRRGSDLVTSGGVSASGSWIILKTYTEAYLWPRPRSSTIAQALQEPACRVPLATEKQGEALAIAPDESGYMTVSEGRHAEIYFYAQRQH